MKTAHEWMQEVWYVDCPHCEETCDGDTPFGDCVIECEHCGKEFRVIGANP